MLNPESKTPLRNAGGKEDRKNAAPSFLPSSIPAFLRGSFLLVILLVSSAHAQSINVRGVERVSITVHDLDTSVAFFTNVLDFKLIDEHEAAGDAVERLTGVFGARIRSADLQLGEQAIELVDFVAAEGKPFPADTRSNDRWFQHIAIVVRDIDEAYAKLREHGVISASTGPQRLPDWNVGAAGIRAFYFRDPDGHFLEVIWFPPGKGNPIWQEKAQSAESLFLGIDHTAIVVSDTETSLAFYRDLLGLSVVGGSENYGVEQEHLNNVFGARLRITTLHGADGKLPGVEFLEYVTPHDGRDTPRDLRVSDLAHWHTTLTVPNVDAACDELVRRRAWLVTAFPVTLDDGSRAAIVRDPDGHGLLLRQPAP